ncbi:MAG: cell division protein FtsQ/DivIB [Kiloniellales bacterium]
MRLLNPFGRKKRHGQGRRNRYTRGRGRRQPLVTLRRALYAGAALSAVLLLAGGTLLWQSGWFGRQAERIELAALALTVDAGLGVDEVLVEGRNRTAAADIISTLKVERGQPILAFDTDAARAKLESLPWVESAAVERQLPGFIYIQLIERRPLAIWQHDGALRVIDSHGVVVPGVEVAGFAELPLLVGADAPQHGLALIRLLESEPALRPLVKAAIRVSGRRWNLRLDNGIDVRLPADDPGRAWAELARIDRENGLLDRGIVTIDLRLPDRLIVRPAPKGESAGEST